MKLNKNETTEACDLDTYYHFIPSIERTEWDLDEKQYKKGRCFRGALAKNFQPIWPKEEFLLHVADN